MNSYWPMACLVFNCGLDFDTMSIRANKLRSSCNLSSTLTLTDFPEFFPGEHSSPFHVWPQVNFIWLDTSCYERFQQFIWELWWDHLWSSLDDVLLMAKRWWFSNGKLKTPPISIASSAKRPNSDEIRVVRAFVFNAISTRPPGNFMLVVYRQVKSHVFLMIKV